VFEAITNAVAHRDYSIPGSKVRLRLFDDRLEIFSPGMLPNTMTTESLPRASAIAATSWIVAENVCP
jgi:predicted HTH transcriptional regulator